MLRSRFLLTAVCLLVAAPAGAGEGTVEKWGEAQIKNGNTVQAKKEATHDALRKCIEYVVGVQIQSGMDQTMQETVKNNQSEFYAKVKDTLVTKADGFVQKYDVLQDETEGDVVKVLVRATVFESKVKAQIKKLTDLIAAAGNPKLMLVIQDVHVAPSGKRRVDSESVLAAYLEKELIARGFELRGQREAKRKADDSEKSYDRWLDDSEAVAKMALSNGADILIAGRVEIKNKGEITNTGGLDALKGQTRIEIMSIVKGYLAATGEVFSSKPVRMSSIGINVERASHRAFKGRGSNLVKQTFEDLLADLKESFKKTAAQGQSYVVALKGVKSFRKQGRSFMSVLSAVDGVQDVKQKSFKAGNLEVDLSCKCSSNELQDRIFNAIEGHDQLDALDIENVHGKQLTFKL